MVYIPLLLVKWPQENCLKSSFIWCQIFQLQTIEKYNRYSTFIIYYNKLSKSSRLKLIGRHCVLADFLPNTLTKKIYIYIYVYIYIYHMIYAQWWCVFWPSLFCVPLNLARNETWVVSETCCLQWHIDMFPTCKESCIINF